MLIGIIGGIVLGLIAGCIASRLVNRRKIAGEDTVGRRGLGCSVGSGWSHPFAGLTASAPLSPVLRGTFSHACLALGVLFFADVAANLSAPYAGTSRFPASLIASARADGGGLSFSQLILSANGIAYQRVIGDLDGDARNDIVAINDVDLYWFAAPGWQPQILVRLAAGTHGYPFFRADDLQLADIDGDGDLDVVARVGDAGDINGKVVWFRNPRPGAPVTAVWSMIDIGVNTYTKDIVVRDFDGDGKPDVVTREDSRTQVWFQNTPTSWTRKETAHPPHEGMDVGDLDGDGDPDIVLNGFWLKTPANPRTGTYTQHTIDSKWFTNQPAGWQNYSSKVVVADIDGNGRQDVVLSHSELPGYPVSWYSAADATGTWTEHVITLVCDYCHNLQAADFDLDGHTDVLAGGMIQSAQKGLTLYRGNGGGTWEAMPIQTLGSYSAEIGDIDNDSDIDIVTVRQWNLAPTELWRNEFYRPPSLDLWTYIQADATRGSWGDWDDPSWLRYFGLAFADIDRDGDLDIVSGRYFYRNPGGEMTAPWQRIDFGFNVDALLTVDVDGDVRADVIGTRGSTVYWLEADDEAGTSWTARTIDTTAPTESHVNPQGYAVADLIAGGRPEVLIANGGSVFYYTIPSINPEAGNWPRTQIMDETNGEGIGIADMDGDGKLDVAAAHYANGLPNVGPRQIKWARNPGNGSANWPEYIIGVFPGDFADRLLAADLNGDGRPDIIVTEENQPVVPSYSTYWYAAPPDPTQPNWQRQTLVTQHTTNSMDLADMDGDGDTDVVLGEHRSSTNSEKVAVWENDGAGTFTEHVVDLGKESHLGARVADLNGDGALDIVSIAWDEYWYLHVWRNDGVGYGSSSGSPPLIDITAGRRPVSRRTHGSAGDFDVDLLAPGGDVIAVEGRRSGPSKLVVTFTRAVQGVDGLDPTDVSLVSNTAGPVPVSSVSLDDLTLTIQVSLLPEGRLTLSFPGLADANDLANPVLDILCFAVLPADVNDDEAVNIFDLIAVRNALNQTVTANNYRNDVTSDGVINIFDLIAVRNNLNHYVSPPCP